MNRYKDAGERARMPDGSISASRFIAECDAEDRNRKRERKRALAKAKAALDILTDMGSENMGHFTFAEASMFHATTNGLIAWATLIEETDESDRR